jgi:dCMP deaminase
MTDFTQKDKQYMEDARAFANNHSKDRSTKVGALITEEDGSPLSWGYNGFPRGANDNPDDRHERPLKYLWTEHAERNAIYNAARRGIKLLGSRMYTTLFCCPDCSRAVIQAGIKKVFIAKEAFDEENPRVKAWLENWPLSKQMFEECGVEVIVEQ